MKNYICAIASVLLVGSCFAEESALADFRTAQNPQGSLGIVRHIPEGDYRDVFPAGAAFPVYDNESKEFYQVDVRSADLTGYDLHDRYNDLIHASFDSRTKWPRQLPAQFKPVAMMDLGKDPGLNVRKLHARGITGKRVGIALIDSCLFVDHEEYADRLRLYEEIHVIEDPEMHGPAVASIAVGKTVGIAPAADLYYIAASFGSYQNGAYGYDYQYLARAITRICEINSALPADGKIRVLGFCCRVKEDRLNYRALRDAIGEAERQGLLVLYVGSSDVEGMYREPNKDPNDPESYGPGLYWERRFYGQGRNDRRESPLLIPSDSRCVASPTGKRDYAFYCDGGLSWTVPYVAGLYALACQVNPSVTPASFMSAVKETGDETVLFQNGKSFRFGKIANPVGLMRKLGGEAD